MSSRIVVCVLRLFYFLIFIGLSFSDYVPVVFIATDKSLLPQSSFSAVEKLSKEDFLNDYLEKAITKGPVVFFQQDTLSAEDYSYYGNVYGENGAKESFQNLKFLSSEYPSLYLPSVEAIKIFPEKFSQDWKIIEMNKNSVSKLNNDEFMPSSLISFKLPDTILASDRGLALKENDDIIGDVFKMLETFNKTFSVIFTAQRPSWISDMEDHVRMSRHILEAVQSNDTYILYSDNLTMFYAQNVKYFIASNATSDLIIDLPENVTGTSHININDSIILTLSFDVKNEVLQNLDVKFTFSHTAFSWSLDGITISGTAQEKFESELQVSDIWTPSDYSYTCKNTGKIYSVANDSRGLIFDSIQIQPFFNSTSGRFGDQFDCVGFFTTPIWMSIFISLLFIIILAFGISLLMDINTMDRFDDPKGKTIQVATVE